MDALPHQIFIEDSATLKAAAELGWTQGEHGETHYFCLNEIFTERRTGCRAVALIACPCRF